MWNDDFIPDLDALSEPWNRSNAPGCVVAVYAGGELVYQRAVGMADLERGVPLRPRSIFDIASTSKQFVAACIHLLAQAGELDLDADVGTFFPRFPDLGERLTVRHMIHHTSGIRDYLTLMHLAGLSFANDYYEEEIVDLLARQRALNFPPGSEFLYSNSGYFLLGEIVRQVSGQGLGTFAKKHIFEPLGMKQTQFYDDYGRIVPQRAIGYVPDGDGGFRTELYLFDLVGDGGLLTCVGDLLLWDRNFYDNRLAGGPALLQALHETHPLTDGGSNNYAAGLFLSTYRGLPTVAHGGSWAGYRSEMLRFPEQGVTLVVLANRADFDASRLARRLADVVLAAHLAPLPESEARPPDGGPPDGGPPPPAPDLARHAGSYRNPQTGTILRVTLNETGDTLLVHHPAGLEFALVSTGPGQFVTDESAPVTLQALFDRDQDGQAQLILQGEVQPRTVFVTFTPAQPTTADLEAYVGRYVSGELRATYNLMIEEDRLVLTLGYDPQSYWLEPAGDDEFTGHGTLFHFTRTDDGRVDGFHVRAGRVNQIAFRRA